MGFYQRSKIFNVTILKRKFIQVMIEARLLKLDYLNVLNCIYYT